jgi:hypothetical protein
VRCGEGVSSSLGDVSDGGFARRPQIATSGSGP